MVIKLSAEEFERLSNDCEKRRGDIDEIGAQVERAVKNKNIESAAGTAIESLWNEHKAELEDLKNDLEAWSRYCNEQADVARYLIRPLPGD